MKLGACWYQINTHITGLPVAGALYLRSRRDIQQLDEIEAFADKNVSLCESTFVAQMLARRPEALMG